MNVMLEDAATRSRPETSASCVSNFLYILKSIFKGIAMRLKVPELYDVAIEIYRAASHLTGTSRETADHVANNVLSQTERSTQAAKAIVRNPAIENAIQALQCTDTEGAQTVIQSAIADLSTGRLHPQEGTRFLIELYRQPVTQSGTSNVRMQLATALVGAIQRWQPDMPLTQQDLEPFVRHAGQSAEDLNFISFLDRAGIPRHTGRPHAPPGDVLSQLPGDLLVEIGEQLSARDRSSLRLGNKYLSEANMGLLDLSSAHPVELHTIPPRDLQQISALPAGIELEHLTCDPRDLQSLQRLDLRLDRGDERSLAIRERFLKSLPSGVDVHANVVCGDQFALPHFNATALRYLGPYGNVPGSVALKSVSIDSGLCMPEQALSLACTLHLLPAAESISVDFGKCLLGDRLHAEVIQALPENVTSIKLPVTMAHNSADEANTLVRSLSALPNLKQAEIFLSSVAAASSDVADLSTLPATLEHLTLWAEDWEQVCHSNQFFLAGLSSTRLNSLTLHGLVVAFDQSHVDLRARPPSLKKITFQGSPSSLPYSNQDPHQVTRMFASMNDGVKEVTLSSFLNGINTAEIDFSVLPRSVELIRVDSPAIRAEIARQLMARNVKVVCTR